MNTRDTDLRYALALSGLSIGWSGIVGSLAIFSALASGSLSLLGFGVDAVIDAVASAVLIWRFRVEARQPERAARVEHLAERVVGLALLVLALYLVTGAIRALVAQTHPEATALSIGLLVASAVVLPPLALGKYRVAGRLGSGALRADSILTLVAAVLAAISLVSLAASETLGLWWADAIAALAVGSIIAREGWVSLRLSRSTAEDG
ncbi:MAG: cation transporter [Chloroflexi bacterium]|nr:cation transporter [Chloroflexota bacterium]